MAYVRFTERERIAVSSPAFCQGSLQLTQLLTGLGAPGLGRVPDSTTAAAVKQVVVSMGATLDGFEASAPSSVRGDVRGVVSALRAAANGDISAVRSSEFERAGTRISDARQALSGCGQAAGSAGEGG